MTTGHRVAYHNNGTPHDDESSYFMRLLTSLGNHRKAVPDAVIVVVNHAAGLHILEQAATDDALGSRLADLRRSGVRFLVCANTLASRQIDWHSLPGVTAADIVPSGVVALAEFQLDGYAYLHL
jgi:intracellular sulfur oxidation DsrE/DsrF family protein